MRVIQVAGLSGSGKTTFITELIPRLGKIGPVAVIKHLGHHQFTLDPDKDTTRFTLAGASISVGIDNEKSVWALREPDLDRVLMMLGCMGTAFAVIEGFKSRSFPKIIIGDLDGVDPVLMTNPSVDEVLAGLDLFPCMTGTGRPAPDSMVPESGAREGVTLTLEGSIQALAGSSPALPQDAGMLAAALRSAISSPGVSLEVALTPASGMLRTGKERTSLSVHAAHPGETLVGMRKAVELFEDLTKKPCDQTGGVSR